MITATVRYKLPPHIDHDACREHFHKIAPGFQQVQGLISKHFIWSESGWAGGVYQWQTLEDARRFYSGPWLDGRVRLVHTAIGYGEKWLDATTETYTNTAKATLDAFSALIADARAGRQIKG